MRCTLRKCKSHACSPRFKPLSSHDEGLSRRRYTARLRSTLSSGLVNAFRPSIIRSNRPETPPLFDSPSFGDLSNPVHPIFQPQNFVDHTIHQSTVVNSLKLASRFLTTDLLLPFWYTLLCGPIETAMRPCSSPLIPVMSLDGQQEKDVIAKLELLASCVTFASERTPGPGDSGFTQRLLADAPPPFLGVKSHITISKRVFKVIEGSFSRDRSNASRLWHQFLLADLLLHEVAHAAMYAAHPRPPAHDPIQAYFLPGARTTEEGMEWETYVFGGLLYEVPSLLFRKPEGGLSGTKVILREWPSPRLVANYRKSIYPRPFPVKGDMSHPDRVWVVHARYIERLFTTAFWEAVVPSIGPGALRPACYGPFISRGLLGLLTLEDEDA